MGAMADSTRTLLSRPPGPRAPRRPPGGPPAGPTPRPLTLAGVVAAAQSAGLGALVVMVLVLVGWAGAADSEASARAAVAAALQAWLVAHHTDLAIPGGTFSLTPLGLTALPVALLHTATLRAGRAAGIGGRRGVLALTSAVTATYAVIAVLVALLSRTDAVRPAPASAFLGAAAVAALASGTGAVRSTRRWLVLWHRVPGLVRTALPAAAVATAVLVAGGALLTGGLLAVRYARAEALVAALDAGPAGALLLLVGALLYVPSAAVWAVGLATGPGFAVGTGTSVTLAGSDLGAVPAMPLLAALPEGDGGLRWLALLLPVAAGAAAALVVRRAARRPGPARRPLLSCRRDDLEVAGATGIGAGTVVALLSALSAGSAGPGRMAEVGPDWWAVGPVTALEVAAVAAAVLLALRWRDGRA